MPTDDMRMPTCTHNTYHPTKCINQHAIYQCNMSTCSMSMQTCNMPACSMSMQTYNMLACTMSACSICQCKHACSMSMQTCLQYVNAKCNVPTCSMSTYSMQRLNMHLLTCSIQVHKMSMYGHNNMYSHRWRNILHVCIDILHVCIDILHADILHACMLAYCMFTLTYCMPAYCMFALTYCMPTYCIDIWHVGLYALLDNVLCMQVGMRMLQLSVGMAYINSNSACRISALLTHRTTPHREEVD